MKYITIRLTAPHGSQTAADSQPPAPILHHAPAYTSPSPHTSLYPPDFSAAFCHFPSISEDSPHTPGQPLTVLQIDNQTVTRIHLVKHWKLLRFLDQLCDTVKIQVAVSAVKGVEKRSLMPSKLNVVYLVGMDFEERGLGIFIRKLYHRGKRMYSLFRTFVLFSCFFSILTFEDNT